MRVHFRFERRHLLIVVVGLYWGIGFLLGNGALWLIGALLVLLPSCHWWRLRRQVDRIKVERVSVKWGFEGQTVEVRLFVRNESPWPIFHLRITDHFEPDIHFEKVSLIGQGDILPAYSQAEFRYLGYCYFDRGVYSLGPIAIRLGEPFELFSASRLLPDIEQFLVYPEVAPLDELGLAGDGLHWNPYACTMREPGNSLNFIGVRDYRYGDPVRFIHWGQTARRDELMVREREREVASPVVVLTDLQLKGRAGTGKESIEEYGVKVTVSLASRALQGGSPTGVLINSVPEVAIDIGFGESHHHRVLRSMIDVRQKSKVSFDVFLERNKGLIPRFATCFVVLSAAWFHWVEIEKVIDFLAAQENRVITVLLDDDGLLAYEAENWEIQNRPDCERMAELLCRFGADKCYRIGRLQSVHEGMREPIFSGWGAEVV